MWNSNESAFPLYRSGYASENMAEDLSGASLDPFNEKPQPLAYGLPSSMTNPSTIPNPLKVSYDIVTKSQRTGIGQSAKSATFLEYEESNGHHSYELASEKSGSTGRKRKTSEKAERAKESRRRKKEYLQNLENTVKSLSDRIRFLHAKEARERRRIRSEERNIRRKLGREYELYENVSQKQRQSIARMKSLLNDANSSEEQFSEAVSCFISTSRFTSTLVSQQFDDLLECFDPDIQTKFTLWLLSRPQDFFSNKTGLWPSLVEEIGITQEQTQRLLANQERMSRCMDKLPFILERIQDLSKKIVKDEKALFHTIDQACKILDPRQLAKFCVWVQENHWCMQMLNSLWNLSQ